MILHCVYVSHLLYSSVDGHLGCFHVLVVVNSAAMNSRVRVSLKLRVFSRYMPRSGIAGSHGSIFNFWGASTLLSIAAAPIYIPTNSVGGFLFLHTLFSIYYLETFCWWPFWLTIQYLYWFWFVQVFYFFMILCW